MNEIVILFVKISAIVCAAIVLLWWCTLILFGLSAWIIEIIISIFC